MSCAVKINQNAVSLPSRARRRALSSLGLRAPSKSLAFHRLIVFTSRKHAGFSQCEGGMTTLCDLSRARSLARASEARRCVTRPRPMVFRANIERDDAWDAPNAFASLRKEIFYRYSIDRAMFVTTFERVSPFACVLSSLRMNRRASRGRSRDG